MYLGELIEELAKHDPKKVVRHGFSTPHSYRGYYDELAFEPTASVAVGDMLADARDALGTTYGGWKGGGWTMSASTPCHLAYEGSTGDPLDADALHAMLGGSHPHGSA